VVAAQAGTDIKMTSQVLRSLERKKLIEREVDAADARARRLHITRRGAQLAPRAIAVVETVDSAFFAAVPRQRTLSFLRPLAQLPEPAAAGAAGRNGHSTNSASPTLRGAGNDARKRRTNADPRL